MNKERLRIFIRRLKWSEHWHVISWEELTRDGQKGLRSGNREIMKSQGRRTIRWRDET